MQVKVTFDVELPEKFIIEKDQLFEFAPEEITYRKLLTSYEKSVKNGETEIITIEEAAKDYFLASTFSNDGLKDARDIIDKYKVESEV